MLLALAATACDATVYRDSGTAALDYGNSVRQNTAVMVIDPQPATAANTEIDFDGRRAGLAIERYREGKVIPPHQMRTSEVLSGSE
jgi:type IV pilus biogenesis protein CpaD/CtpE